MGRRATVVRSIAVAENVMSYGAGDGDALLGESAGEGRERQAKRQGSRQRVKRQGKIADGAAREKSGKFRL
jgi:hypothetical protein